MKKILLIAVKLILSTVLIAYLFIYRVDISEVIRVFTQVKPGWLVLGASLHITGLLLSSLRWKILLSAQGIQQRISRLFSYYMVGHFFNMFLPTKVGGDVVRIYDTSKDHGTTAQPFAVIMVERVSGLLTMLLLAALVVLVDVNIGVDLKSRIPGLTTGIVVFLAGFALLPLAFHPRVEQLLFHWLFRLPGLNKLESPVKKVYAAFKVYGNKKWHLAGALSVGAVLQVNYFMHYYFIARALGADLPVAFFFVIIPVRSVALMIPFFINGIGLREFFDVTAFNLVGISQSTGLAFAELAWFIQIAFALVGGVVYVTRRRKPDAGKTGAGE